jgi:transposase
MANEQGRGTDEKDQGEPQAGSQALGVIHPNAAGIDVGSTEHWVAVPRDRCDEPVRCFGCSTPQLHKMADWLVGCGIDTVAIESTGAYWVAMYEVPDARGLKVILVNTLHVKTVPGRKSDVLDCQWLQQLHSLGLLHASFRPTREIVELRAYLRQREGLVKGASQQVLRMQKALVLMNVQLASVVTDIAGQTGMAIIRAIVAGERDPQKLAAHRDPRCRASAQTIAEALVGNYQPEHVLALRQCLRLYDTFEQLIAECDETVEQWMEDHVPTETDLPPLPAPLKKERNKSPVGQLRESLYRLTGVDLTSIPGIASFVAVLLISEIGTDMSKWPTMSQFTAWLRVAPGTKKSGGKVLSSHTLPSTNRALILLRLAAVAAGRTNTGLGAYYRRQAARKGKGHAVACTAHKLARIIYSMLKNRKPLYVEHGEEAGRARQTARRVSNLRRQAKSLGFNLIALSEPAVTA